MSDEDLDRLLNHATARRVPQGDAVFEQGQQAVSFFLLLHGRLKVTQVTEDGVNRLVRLKTEKRYDPLEGNSGFLAQLTSRITLHLSLGEAF